MWGSTAAGTLPAAVQLSVELHSRNVIHNPSGAPKTRDYLAVRRFVGRSPAASVAEREAPEKLAVGRIPFLTCQLLESRTCQDQTERPMREGNR